MDWSRPFDEKTANAIDTIVQNYLDNLGTPGAAIAIVQDGKVVHSKGYGKRIYGQDLPVTEKTLFPMVFNEEIRNYINLYLRRKNQVSVMLGLAKYYFPMFDDILEASFYSRFWTEGDSWEAELTDKGLYATGTGTYGETLGFNKKHIFYII